MFLQMTTMMQICLIKVTTDYCGLKLAGQVRFSERVKLVL